MRYHTQILEGMDMSDGQEAFRARLARIKTNAPKTATDARPTVHAERIAGPLALRRNTKPVGVGDLLRGVWDIQTFRYGLPMLIAVFGFAVLSSFKPQGMHQAMLSSLPEDEQATAVPPFNAGNLALNRQAEFVDAVQAAELTGADSGARALFSQP
jgi:hypothetical protein